jgi:hypothetical protein
MRSAHSDDVDAAADKNPASTWFCQPVHVPQQGVRLVSLARRIRKVYMDRRSFGFWGRICQLNVNLFGEFRGIVAGFSRPKVSIFFGQVNLAQP